MDSAKTHHLFKLSGMELGLYIYSAMFSTLQSRARVNIKQASVQTPGSSVFVVWNARGFDFWRMNRRTYSTFRYTLIQQSSFRILYETSMGGVPRWRCREIRVWYILHIRSYKRLGHRSRMQPSDDNGATPARWTAYRGRYGRILLAGGAKCEHQITIIL